VQAISDEDVNQSVDGTRLSPPGGGIGALAQLAT